MTTTPTKVKLEDALGYSPDYSQVGYSYNKAENKETLATAQYHYVATVKISKMEGKEKPTFAATELENDKVYAFELDTYNSTTSRNVVSGLNNAVLFRSPFRDGLEGEKGFIQNSYWLDDEVFTNDNGYTYTKQGDDWGMVLKEAKVYRLTHAEYTALVGNTTGIARSNALVAGITAEDSKGVNVTEEYLEAVQQEDDAFNYTVNADLKNNKGTTYTGAAGEKLALEYEGSVYMFNGGTNLDGISEVIGLENKEDGKLGIVSPDASISVNEEGVVKAGDTVINGLAITGAGNDSITGSEGNDWINAGEGDDYIDSKGGNDIVKFTGNFGNDNVFVAKGTNAEPNSLNLNIVDGNGDAVSANDLVYSVSGNNLVVSTKIEYIAEADVYGTAWGNTIYQTGTTTATDSTHTVKYTFKLAEYHDTQYPEEGLEQGVYMWKAETPYGKVNSNDRYWLLDNTLFKNALQEDGTCTITEDGIHATKFRIYRYVNGVKGDDVTVDFCNDLGDAVNSSFDNYNDSLAETYFNKQIEGSVTVNNYLSADTVYNQTTITGGESVPQKGVTVKVNGTDIETLTNTVALNDNVYTGSRLNDSVISTKNNESFNLGSVTDTYIIDNDSISSVTKGYDVISFKENFGNDTITVNENERLNLSIKNTAGDTISADKFVAVVKDDDVIVTTSEEVSYILEAVTTGETPQTLQFTLNTSSIPAGYVWKSGDKTLEVDKVATLVGGDSIEGYSSAKLYKAIDGIFSDADSISAYNGTTDNETLYSKQGVTDGTITLKGIANSDVKGSKLTINDSITAEHITFIPSLDSENNTYTGSRFNDLVYSTTENDIFELGTSAGEGNDRIVLSGNFGNDTATLSSGENLALDYTYTNYFGSVQTNANELVSSAIKGNNLILATEVKYVVEATDTKNKKYNFEISQGTGNAYAWSYTKGKQEFALTSSNLTSLTAKTPTEVTIIDSAASDPSKAAKLTLASAKVYEVINGEKFEITGAYTNVSLAHLFENQLSGSVTVNDYKTRDAETALKVAIAGGDPVKYENIRVAKNNVFTGTDADDYAVSTEENETFNLKKGTDTILFSRDFGEDTINLTKEEVVNLKFNYENRLNIANSAFDDVVTKTVVGNNLVISSNVEYYATAKVYGKAYGNDIKTNDGKNATAENPAEYEFKLNTVQISSEEAMADSVAKVGNYVWKSVQSYGKNADNADCFIGIEESDIKNAENYKVTAGENPYHYVQTAFDGATVTDFRIFQNVNGVVTEITEQYYANASSTNYELTQALYENELTGTVTVKNFTKDSGADICINDKAYEYTVQGAAAMQEVANNKGKLNGSSGKDNIDLTEYVSPNDLKGVTVNSGSGNDVIKGSMFNDTVTSKSLEGQTATVTQVAGNNKVTFGKGNDVFNATLANGGDGGYSSNNVNMGLGDNTAVLTSVGNNKLTVGDGANNLTMKNGVNTVKVGNAKKSYTGIEAANTLTLNGGLNNVTSGKGVDKYIITDGNNTVNSGAGLDTFNIAGGYNTIKTGADKKVVTVTAASTNTITTGKDGDEFTLAAGTNIINSGAGNDKFVVTGGSNILNGGAGDDEYDLSGFGFGNKAVIIDTTGDNTYKFGAKADSIFFDVSSVKVNKNGAVTSYKLGNEVVLTNDEIFGGFGGGNNGVDIKTGTKNSILTADKATNKGNSTITVGDTNYKLDVTAIAENVAAWLSNSDYKSAAAVFEKGKEADIATLTALYTNDATANACYQAVSLAQ